MLNQPNFMVLKTFIFALFLFQCQALFKIYTGNGGCNKWNLHCCLIYCFGLTGNCHCVRIVVDNTVDFTELSEMLDATGQGFFRYMSVVSEKLSFWSWLPVVISLLFVSRNAMGCYIIQFSWCIHRQCFDINACCLVCVGLSPPPNEALWLIPGSMWGPVIKHFQSAHFGLLSMWRVRGRQGGIPDRCFNFFSEKNYWPDCFFLWVAK